MQYMYKNISSNKITEYSYNNIAWPSIYQASNIKRPKFKNKESCKTWIKNTTTKFNQEYFVNSFKEKLCRKAHVNLSGSVLLYISAVVDQIYIHDNMASIQVLLRLNQKFDIKFNCSQLMAPKILIKQNNTKYIANQVL